MTHQHDPIPIEPTLPQPALPGTVVVRETDDLIDAIIADLLVHAKACVRQFGCFHLALSGGATPEPLYKQLMYDPGCRHFPWKKTHLWIVDERCVPFDDPRSNFGAIRELVVEHSDIPADQVHPIHADEPDAAERYERELCRVLEWRERGHDRLDYALLGMGDDCHTASLFPNSPALAVDDKLVAHNDGPAVTPPARITMTYRLLNATRFVSVFVTGSRKQSAVDRVLSESQSRVQLTTQAIAEFPILGIRPTGGELRWYVDPAACPNNESTHSE